MTRVKHDNLVFTRVVVVLIKSQQLIDTKIWEHTAHAIDEHVWATILIFDADMVDDTLMKELHKLRAMCITSQCVLCVLCLRRVGLFFLQLVFQHTGVLQELLLVEEIAEFLKQIQRQHVHIVDRTNQVRFKLLYLTADVVLLLSRVLVDEEVVKQVAILWVLETWAVQLIVE